MPWHELADRVVPILEFVLCITVVAELANRIGCSPSSPIGSPVWPVALWLWLVVVVLASLSTAVLSLDTTAVLLTPVVFALARSST